MTDFFNRYIYGEIVTREREREERDLGRERILSLPTSSPKGVL